MKPVRTWILVADSAQARIYEHTGPGHGITEIPDKARSHDVKPTREINADRPGRTFDSGGQGRHAKEPPTDPSRHAKRQFAHEVADGLKRDFDAGRFDRLVLIAPPAMLGDLRKALSKNIADVVHGEIAKDLTNSPERDLREALGEVLPV